MKSAESLITDDNAEDNVRDMKKALDLAKVIKTFIKWAIDETLVKVFVWSDTCTANYNWRYSYWMKQNISLCSNSKIKRKSLS